MSKVELAIFMLASSAVRYPGEGLTAAGRVSLSLLLLSARR
jgi:hypothetical protein